MTYSVPAAGEVGWSALSNFLIALGNDAAVAQEMKQAIRVATTTPVTVSNTTDCVVAVKLASAGAVAVALPAGTDGRWFVIADQTGDAATNNITITPNGAETINGAATYVISDNRGAVVLAYSTTNTQWNVVGRYSAVFKQFFEYGLVRSSANGLANTVVENVQGSSITLTPGEWMVAGTFGFLCGTATVTALRGGVSKTSATLPATDTIAFPTACEYRGVFNNPITLTSLDILIEIPAYRCSVTTNTTIYLVANADFSAGTVSAYGSYRAWQIG